MGFKKGHVKIGGRKKGSVNVATKLNIEERLAAFDNGKGFDPVHELMNLYTLIYADNPLVAVKIPLALMEYIFPKRKAVEHTGPEGGPIELERRLKELPEQELLKLLPEAIQILEKV